MNPEPFNWISPLFETARILIVACIPVLILIFDHKSKSQERKNELQFKAREYLYKSFQEEMKASDKIIEGIGQNFGYMLGFISTAEPERKQFYIDGCLKMIRMSHSLMVRSLPTIEKELIERNMMDSDLRQQVDIIITTLAIDYSCLPPDKFEQYANDFMFASIGINVLEKIIAEDRRDRVFEQITRGEFK